MVQEDFPGQHEQQTHAHARTRTHAHARIKQTIAAEAFSETPKLATNGPQAKLSTWGIQNPAPGSTIRPGHENTEDARREATQNNVLKKQNGAMWCK